jgi:transcriptional regulator with XRE-family HTH domain
VFAKELRELRTKAGLTQEEVGSRAGVSREYVSMLESGKNTPTIDVFIRLCEAIDASPGDVITRLARSRPKSSRR